MEKVSIRDVASRAGVSVSTVSRALSRPEMVSESTRRKIQAIAEELDFSVSRTAGNLKSGKSRRIALLIGSNKIEWFTANIMEGLNSVILDQGYDLVFYPISSVEDRRAFFEELPVRNNVDAVIISSFTATAKEITRLHSAHVPLVGINSPSTLNFSATVHTS
ncbi:MAG: LacI family DNA-binding transcriptional regulator, partial [Parascardovia denticolens]